MALKRSEAAKYLRDKWGMRSTPSTLSGQASFGRGPAFQKSGRFPIYNEVELDRWAQSYWSSRTSRNEAIASLKKDGLTYREIGSKFDISRERVRQICTRENLIAMAKWRPYIQGGHPDFDDPYGVDQVFTPMAQFLEDVNASGGMV